ncbi:concanavalin A-like lectin/glucanase domain-containing protein, partial [Dimargaris cristalligena]
CPKEVPCCNQGWCSNEATACGLQCEPGNSYESGSCQPEPVCVDQSDNFSGQSLVEAADFTGNPNRYMWVNDFTPSKSEISNGELQLYMTKNDPADSKGFGARVSSSRYLDYGTLSARVKSASTGLGAVSALIIKNEQGDEIDFEWVGLTPGKVQTNYYYNGVLNWENMIEYDVPGGDSVNTYHHYTIEWDPAFIEWRVDGQTVRRLNKKDTWNTADNQFHFPARPARVQLSIWDGGNDGEHWTEQWAGTPTDWANTD